MRPISLNALFTFRVCDCDVRRMVNKDNVFLTDLEGVTEALRKRGASAELAVFVEDLLLQQHQRYHDFMTAEADKRRTLLEHLHTLEVRGGTGVHASPCPSREEWRQEGPCCSQLAAADCHMQSAILVFRAN